MKVVNSHHFRCGVVLKKGFWESHLSAEVGRVSSAFCGLWGAEGEACVKWGREVALHLRNYCQLGVGGVPSVCGYWGGGVAEEPETWSWKVTRVWKLWTVLWPVELSVWENDIGSHLRQKSWPVPVNLWILQEALLWGWQSDSIGCVAHGGIQAEGFVSWALPLPPLLLGALRAGLSSLAPRPFLHLWTA